MGRQPFGTALPLGGGDDKINAPVVSRRYPWMECPSCGLAGERKSYNPGSSNTFYSLRETRRSNYFFCFYEGDLPWRHYSSDIRQGVFGVQESATMGGVSDGLSNTFLCGEACGGPYKTHWLYGPWGLAGAWTCCMGRAISERSVNPVNFTSAHHYRRWELNHDWEDDYGVVYHGQTYAWVFNSLHPGGAQFCFGDGATRFIRNEIDVYAWWRLNYCHDNEMVSEY
jgi:hypothetical protein